ncbi:hypothetical protein EOT10_15870 [Streptomyces antnestii]|uniref:Uncharacterized protein n=1 Tax=Streptomyces antnestii TaxID=2494256 RepID=A0A437PQJ6_9ACTN|nr:hypothetical protein [Streptomyces sp. San01]RVU24479.1 hypothetical protein EOT10_15870 [Streptomyces sp. San01]
MNEVRNKFVVKKSSRDFVIGVVIVCGLAIGGLVGYQQIFTKGLDRLPDEVCDGAVDREVAAQVLPDARSASEDGSVTGTGENLFFGCRVDTTGHSLVSGEVKVQAVSAKSWSNFYEGYGGAEEGKALQVGVGEVRALSKTRIASIYAPCAPRGVKASTARQPYALIAEVRVLGESRVKGAALRQDLTNFAYQLTQHAYKVGECQDALTFPKEIPSYPSGAKG